MRTAEGAATPQTTDASGTLCDPMNYSRRGSSVLGILQARILEWVAVSFSRESSPPRE